MLYRLKCKVTDANGGIAANAFVTIRDRDSKSPLRVYLNAEGAVLSRDGTVQTDATGGLDVYLASAPPYEAHQRGVQVSLLTANASSTEEIAVNKPSDGDVLTFTTSGPTWQSPTGSGTAPPGTTPLKDAFGDVIGFITL